MNPCLLYCTPLRSFRYIKSDQNTTDAIHNMTFYQEMYQKSESPEKNVKVALLFTDDVRPHEMSKMVSKVQEAKLKRINYITVGIRGPMRCNIAAANSNDCIADKLDDLIREIVSIPMLYQ